MVLVHGGSFIAGDRQSMSKVGEELAGAGFVAVSIDYRLAPEFLYPAPVEDAEAAVDFLKAHANEFNVNASKIGMMGSSAGATIAALVATEEEPPIAAAVTWSGAFDFTKRSTSHQSAAEREGVTLFGCEGTEQECEQQRQEMSPFYRVSPATAPMEMFNSEGDQILLEQPREMDQALEEAGVPHDLIVLAGNGHGIAYNMRAIGPTIDWFGQWLK